MRQVASEKYNWMGMVILFKRIISFLIIAVVGIVSMTSTAFAAAPPIEASPDWQYTSLCSSSLVISGKTATCYSLVTGYRGTTTKIVIMQVLEKKNSAGEWKNYAVWSTTIFDYLGSLTSTKTNLESGTYRLRSVFYVYSGSKKETITKYSAEKTV